ncbi:MAG: ABC transporter permease, partial [Cyclobacteriaceae bacterium]
MFDLDKWQEIFYTIDKNRLRSFITAFNVAWGIFILIILMGFGVGFQNGIKNEFSDDATNTMYFWSGRTSMAHKGMQPGRQIKFNNQDYEAISERVKGIEYLTGIYWVQGEFVVRYENNYSSFQIRSVDVDYPHIEQSVLLDGRFINAKDLKEKRKVAVVGEKVVEVLFKKLDPIGKYITVNGIKYK